MKRKPSPGNVVFTILGLTIGACVATVVDGRWTADWVAATGTWFGAIATVLALLWAVASFRSDQADREISRGEDRTREARERASESEREEQEASRVSIAIQGGFGYANPLNAWQLSGINVRVTNLLEQAIIVKSLDVDPRLVLEAGPLAEYLVNARETKRTRVDLVTSTWEGNVTEEGLAELTISMRYVIGSTTWRRSSTGMPERVR
jgi:hypothetical protein